MRAYDVRIPGGRQARAAVDELGAVRPTAGTLVILPEGGPHAGAGVVNRMDAIGFTVSQRGQPVTDRYHAWVRHECRRPGVVEARIHAAPL